MIAKNIFKELGYDDYDKSYSAILYINSKENIRIWFDTIEKTVEKCKQTSTSAFDIQKIPITFNEIKAINRQIIELEKEVE